MGKGDRDTIKTYEDVGLSAEASYIGSIRNRLLEKYGLGREAYRGFICRHIGEEYSEKMDQTMDPVIETFAGEEYGDEYLQGFSLPEYMEGSLRASTASVYTPEPVAAYLVERGLFYVLEEKFIKKGIARPDCLGFYMALGIILKDNPDMVIRTMDISAGAGLFFLKMLSVMDKALRTCIDSDKEIDEILLKQVNEGFCANDLHSEGLEMFIIVLLNRFLGTFRLEDINPTIYKRDAISDFDFGDSYDLLLGNPPYLGEKGNRDIFKMAKSSDFGKRFYEAKMDYFYYFIYKAVEMLRPGGVLSYVTTNYFTTADGAKKLRAFLSENISFREIYMLDGVNIFSSAKGQHNMLFTLQKKPAYSDKTVLKKASGNVAPLKDAMKSFASHEIRQESIYDIDGNIILYENSLYGEVSRSIRGNAACSIGDVCQVRQGLVSGCDKTSKRNIIEGAENMGLREPIYVFDSLGAVPGHLKSSPFLKPFYKNSDIGCYSLKESEKLVLYVTNDKMEKEGKASGEAVLKHLNPYRAILSKRREVINGARHWYELQWYRDEEIFNGPKIMVPHRAVDNRFVYTEKPCYGSADIYFIHSKMGANHMKAICCILNSSVVYFWLKNNGKRKGGQLELYHTPLKRIPLPKLTEKSIGRLAIMHDCRDRDDSIVDDFVYSLYGLSVKEKEMIKGFTEGERQ
ncbi:MAG: Eco57I restriction-modification methylase domain-containing protein [Peptostreptococcaceae bacterium]|nr:Eco57I restriction-modification methylase domain-containing protein [Peptostreptococcaceae bacterium]